MFTTKKISNLNSCKYYEKAFPYLADDQWKKLDSLSRQITSWNEKVNLVSRKDIEGLIPNHVIAAMSICCVKRFNACDTVIDVGTGGGLPGLPLAIMCPDTQFTLLDSCAKKIRIVEDMAKALDLVNVRALVGRAEQMNESFDFLVGRGVSNLPNYLKMTAHLLKNSNPDCGGDSLSLSQGLLYIKGGDFSSELRQTGITKFFLHRVSDLLQARDTDRDYLQLRDSDKAVLFVPSEQIAKAFRSLRRG
jgi:16S rRNA (guanine527-N7)-methyltransferase